MTRRMLLSALILASLSVGCGEETPRRISDAATSVTATLDVQEFLDAYLAAVGARDTAALRGMYAEPDRFVWMEDGAVRYRSADEVFRSLAQFSPDATIETEIGEPGVTRLGEGAVHAWASFTTTVGGEGGGYSFGGLMSFVLEPADTGWRIVGGHVSSPRSR